MTRPDWRTGDPLDAVALALEEGRTDDALRELVARGQRRPEIARRLGVTMPAVRWRMKQLGLESPPPRVVERRPMSVWLTDAERAELEAALGGGRGLGVRVREVVLRAVREGTKG